MNIQFKNSLKRYYYVKNKANNIVALSLGLLFYKTIIEKEINL